MSLETPPMIPGTELALNPQTLLGAGVVIAGVALLIGGTRWLLRKMGAIEK